MHCIALHQARFCTCAAINHLPLCPHAPSLSLSYCLGIPASNVAPASSFKDKVLQQCLPSRYYYYSQSIERHACPQKMSPLKPLQFRQGGQPTLVPGKSPSSRVAWQGHGPFVELPTHTPKPTLLARQGQETHLPLSPNVRSSSIRPLVLFWLLASAPKQVSRWGRSGVLALVDRNPSIFAVTNGSSWQTRPLVVFPRLPSMSFAIGRLAVTCTQIRLRI